MLGRRTQTLVGVQGTGISTGKTLRHQIGNRQTCRGRLCYFSRSPREFKQISSVVGSLTRPSRLTSGHFYLINQSINHAAEIRGRFQQSDESSSSSSSSVRPLPTTSAARQAFAGLLQLPRSMLLQPRAPSCGLEFSQSPVQAEEEREEGEGEGEREERERCSYQLPVVESPDSSASNSC